MIGFGVGEQIPVARRYVLSPHPSNSVVLGTCVEFLMSVGRGLHCRAARVAGWQGLNSGGTTAGARERYVRRLLLFAGCGCGVFTHDDDNKGSWGTCSLRVFSNAATLARTWNSCSTASSVDIVGDNGRRERCEKNHRRRPSTRSMAAGAGTAGWGRCATCATVRAPILLGSCWLCGTC